MLPMRYVARGGKARIDPRIWASVLGGRRGQFAARGTACDVWIFCQKEIGHFGECQPAHEPMSISGVYPECRLGHPKAAD